MAARLAISRSTITAGPAIVDSMDALTLTAQRLYSMRSPMAISNSFSRCWTQRWEEYTDDLALAVKAVRTLFDCRIILGGYVGGYMDQYIEAFKQKVSKITTFDTDAEYLQVCRYKTESIAAGAALNFISEFVLSI